MLKKISFFMIVALLLPSLVSAGGWSVVTVEDWPEAPRVGTPVELSFAVRAHGRTLAAGLDMTVIAHHAESKRTVRVKAQEENRGYYRTTLSLDQAGTWTWRIEGYGSHPMPDIEVRTASAITQQTRGDLLFVSKGCMTCHINRAIEYQGITVSDGPDLTDYRADPSYLRLWLANPHSIRPATTMPDLDLDTGEIEALVAYFTRR